MIPYLPDLPYGSQYQFWPNTDRFRHTFPVADIYPLRAVFLSDFHGQFVMNTFVYPGAQEIIKWCKPDFIRFHQKRNVFGMRIGIINIIIEHNPFEQGFSVKDRVAGKPVRKRKTIRKGRTAFSLIFGFSHQAERLAEIFLMKTMQNSCTISIPVIAPDDTDFFRACQDGCRGNIQAHSFGQGHTERFVTYALLNAFDVRFNNMGTGGGAFRQKKPSAFQEDRQFVLSAGQGQSDTLFSCKKRFFRHFQQELVKLFSREFCVHSSAIIAGCLLM